MIIKDFENRTEVLEKQPPSVDANQFEHYLLKVMENTSNITDQVTIVWNKEQQKEWQIKIKRLSGAYVLYQVKRSTRDYVYNTEGAMVKYNEGTDTWIVTEDHPNYIETPPIKILALPLFEGKAPKVKIIRKGIDLSNKTEISIIIT